jgi:RimJ/RimL family protein N-acetyltransferase
MAIRPIRREELAAFTTFSDDPGRNADLAHYVTGLLDGDYLRLDWCLVSESDEDGAVTGRIVFSSDRGERAPRYLVFLDLPWSGDYLAAATSLIHGSLALLPATPGENIECLLDVPSPRVPHPERTREALVHAGFRLTLDRRRFEWTSGHPLPAAPRRLTFRSLTEVGDEAFVAAMARVSEGALDHYTAARRDEIGALAAAREHFRDEQRYQKRYEPAWWQLGYTPEGALAGLVMPAENNAWPNIGYIGVVPEQRGRGYVDELLAQGTRTLAAEGATRIIADTDLANVPMANAFLRGGYTQFATRTVYALDRGGPRDG